MACGSYKVLASRIFKESSPAALLFQEQRLHRSICALDRLALIAALIGSIAQLVYVGNRDKAKDVDTTELLALARTVAG